MTTLGSGYSGFGILDFVSCLSLISTRTASARSLREPETQSLDWSVIGGTGGEPSSCALAKSLSLMMDPRVIIDSAVHSILRAVQLLRRPRLQSLDRDSDSVLFQLLELTQLRLTGRESSLQSHFRSTSLILGRKHNL